MLRVITANVSLRLRLKAAEKAASTAAVLSGREVQRQAKGVSESTAKEVNDCFIGCNFDTHRSTSHRSALHRIALQRIAAHRIASHRIASHRSASHRESRPVVFATGGHRSLQKLRSATTALSSLRWHAPYLDACLCACMCAYLCTCICVCHTRTRTHTMVESGRNAEFFIIFGYVLLYILCWGYIFGVSTSIDDRIYLWCIILIFMYTYRCTDKLFGYNALPFGRWESWARCLPFGLGSLGPDGG